LALVASVRDDEDDDVHNDNDVHHRSSKAWFAVVVFGNSAKQQQRKISVSRKIPHNFPSRTKRIVRAPSTTGANAQMAQQQSTSNKVLFVCCCYAVEMNDERL
jgi:hypothetical protein